MKKLIAVLALGATLPVMASSGVYVGGQLGWSSLTAEIIEDGGGGKFKDNTFMGGAYAGYEFDMDQFFIAIEGDMNFGDAKKKQGKSEYKRGSLYGVSGLIGMPITPEFDIYGRAGWARTEFKAKHDTDGEGKSKRNGYSVGVGGRYHFAPQMAARLEYRYYGYKKFKMSDDAGSWNNKNKEHMITVGLQYMF